MSGELCSPTVLDKNSFLLLLASRCFFFSFGEAILGVPCRCINPVTWSFTPCVSCHFYFLYVYFCVQIAPFYKISVI